MGPFGWISSRWAVGNIGSRLVIREATPYRRGVSVVALQPRERFDRRCQRAQAGGGGGDDAGALDEIVDAERGEEARAAAGGEDVIGPREVVA
jgi:hypothetical protein